MICEDAYFCFSKLAFQTRKVFFAKCWDSLQHFREPRFFDWDTDWLGLKCSLSKPMSLSQNCLCCKRLILLRTNKEEKIFFFSFCRCDKFPVSHYTKWQFFKATSWKFTSYSFAFGLAFIFFHFKLKHSFLPLTWSVCKLRIPQKDHYNNEPLPERWWHNG